MRFTSLLSRKNGDRPPVARQKAGHEEQVVSKKPFAVKGGDRLQPLSFNETAPQKLTSGGPGKVVKKRLEKRVI
jgi:hypothetical protein